MDAETKARIRDAFRAADADGDGVIAYHELKAVFFQLGEWCDEDFEYMFHEFDRNGDGVLQYNEFLDWVMSDDVAGGCEDEAINIAEEAIEAAEELEEDEHYGDEDEDDEYYSDLWEEEEEEEWDDFGEDYEDPEFDGPEDDEIVEEAADENGKFVDNVFPASEASVGGAEGDTASGAMCGDVVGWKRLDTGFCLLRDVRPTDLLQGGLGDCWFVAACASVANYPQWVQQIFSKTPEMSSTGKYEVRLWHPGKKHFMYVTVSDELPVIDDAGTTAFCSPTAEKEIWPCLLEKALAKFYKSFSNIEGGFGVWGMVYLSGGDGEMWSQGDDGNWKRSTTHWNGGEEDQLDNRDEAERFCDGAATYTPSQLWQALMAYSDKSFPMCCGTNEIKGDAQGIVGGHAYSLITVRELKVKKNTLRLCKVRNPHGCDEWTGKWGDKSDMWLKHPSVAKQLCFKRVEDGTFWMSFRDFQTYFPCVEVVKRSMPLEGVHPDKLRAMAARAK